LLCEGLLKTIEKLGEKKKAKEGEREGYTWVARVADRDREREERRRGGRGRKGRRG
jgi:hypothetical protein